MLRSTQARLDAEHVSAGTARASIKELTLCLRKAWYGRRDGSKENFDPDVQGLTRMLMGTAWGDLLNPNPERRVELNYEQGIVSGRVDLDLEDYVNDLVVPVPVELKLTYYSKSKPLADMSQFVEQLAGYLVGTPEALGHGMLGVLHMGMPPALRVFDLRFKDHELDAWDREIGRRFEAVLNDKIPSLADHYQWECRYCQYWQKNGGPCPGGDGKLRGFFKEEE